MATSARKNPFDKAARFAARLDAAGFLAWALKLPPTDFAFRQWLDTRNIPFPDGDDRTGDTVAWVDRATAGGVPWAVAVEFQIEPDPRMFGRLGRYLHDIWLDKKPDDERGSRFHLGGVIVNLTGRGNAARAFDWPDAGLRTVLMPREINAESESAEELLGEIESGARPRALLPWVALMTGAGEADTVERWKHLADAEPEYRARATYGGLARVFADAARCHQVWSDSLRRWNLRESLSVNEWIQEGRQEGRVEGRVEGRHEGRLELLEAVLTTKFGPLSPQTMDRLRELPDDQLKSVSIRFVTATSLADLGL
jgi:hypothetical protein